MPRTALALLLAFGLSACGSAPDAPKHDAHVDHAGHDAHASPDAHAGHDAHASHDAGLMLDHGRKWVMDDHTRAAFADVRAAVTTASVETPADAAALATTLDAHLKTLISGCTMTGASHDQLHVFLTTFMPAIEALGKATDTADAKARLAELRRQVDAYDAHFE